MKKLVCTLVITAFSVTSIFATHEVINEKSKKLDVVKENTIELKVEKKLKSEESLFRTYRGRCADGYTFRFSASNRDEAQGYVNGYCAARRAL